MSRNKWKAKGIPLQALALKLAEEAGEVGNVLTDSLVTADGYAERKLSRRDRETLLSELDHAIFIAQTMRKRVKALA